MANDDEPSSPVKLDYQTPRPQQGLSRRGAFVLATICLLIGVPICGIGVGGVFAGRVQSILDGCWALSYILFGSAFCYAGMRFKRRLADPPG